jgi:hypothetical protein
VKKKARLALSLAAALAISLPMVSSPADASHRCGLEGVSHTVNTICENYHSPKLLIPYVVCIATGKCPIS